MSVTTRYYRGYALTVPDAYSGVDDSGGSIQPPIGVLYPLIIGDCQGGIPNKVMTFVSPQAARNVLKSGPLLDAVVRAFMPFQQNTADGDKSPYLVRAIRLGDGTPLNGPHAASLVLGDTTPGVNEVQHVVFPAPLTAGTFTLGFGGLNTTGIPYNATASAIQTAFTGLASVGAGNATVTGTATAGPLVITYIGTLGAQNVALATVNTSAATPSTAATVTETTRGVAAGVPVINLTSVDYGAYTNSFRVTIDTPDASNPNKFGYKVGFAYSPASGLPAQGESFDNIGRYGIDITYLGSAATCLLTINGTSLTTVCAGNAADNLTIPFASYPTIQEVVDQINLHPVYSAEVADVYGARSANQMDYITGVDVAVPITVTYVGTGTAATLAIQTSPTGNVLVTNITGAAADDVTLALNENTYPTVDSLMVALTGVAGVVGGATTVYTGPIYTATVKNAMTSMPVTNIQLTEMAGSETTNDIEPDADDTINILSPLTPVVAAAYSTTANVQAVIDHLNEFYSTLFTATRVGTTALPLRTSPVPRFFTAGMDAVMNRSGWLTALQTAATTDAQIIVPLTPDPYIHNAVKVHCAIMSAPDQQKERVAIVGGDVGESVLDARNRAMNLGVLSDGDLVQLVYPGITDTDFNGNTVTIPPYMLAAQMAGMSCALGVGKAKTNKYIKAVGVEQKLNRIQLADLITAGVTPLESIESGFAKGFRVAKDISTWLSTPNFIKHLFATKIASQAVSRIVRQQCQPLIGLPNDKNFELRLKNRIETTLDNLTTMGVLVASDKKPAWRNINIVRDTDTVRIDFEATIVTEVDFIFITAHLDVFRAANSSVSQ